MNDIIPKLPAQAKYRLMDRQLIEQDKTAQLFGSTPGIS